MSRRLPLALVGACLLLSVPALLWGQGMPVPGYCPPGYPQYYGPVTPGPYSYPYAPMMQPQQGYPGTTPMPGYPGTMPMPGYPGMTPMMPAPQMPPPRPQPEKIPTLPQPTPQPSAPGNTQPPTTPTAPSSSAGSEPMTAQQPTDSQSSTAPTSPSETPSPSMDTPSLASAAPAAGSSANSSVAPNMIGDFFGMRFRRAIQVPVTRGVNYTLRNTTFSPTVVAVGSPSGQNRLTGTITLPGGGTAPVPIGAQRFILLAPGQSIQVNGTIQTSQTVTTLDYAANRGAIKISDYESPRPQDRAYFGYQYYANLVPRATVQPAPQQSTGSFALDSASPFVTNYVTSGTSLLTSATATDVTSYQLVQSPARLNREIFGIERSFNFGGHDGSLGLRVPLYQIQGDAGFSDVGDATVVFKYVMLGCQSSPSLMSVGMNATLPTSGTLRTIQGDLRSVLLQPWLGYVYTKGNLYMQGFHAMVLPTDSRDTTFTYNSMALGYRIYQAPCFSEGFINMVAAQAEFHTTNPLNNTGPTAPVVVPNLLVGTLGLQIGIGDSLLTLAYGQPFGGGKLFDYELTGFLTYYF